MASEPPEQPLNDEPPEEGRVPRGSVGAFMAHDSLIPASQLAPIVQAEVGRAKAEVRSEFEDRLAKIDDLPSLTQMIVANIVTIAGAAGLLFAIAAYFGDRQDTAIERSGSIAGSLSRIEGKIDQNTKDIELLENAQKAEAAAGDQSR
ncbi:MAG: hypothetical protein ACN4E6_01650 [Qipengyuania pacifica]